MNFFVYQNKFSPPLQGCHSIFKNKSADSYLKDAEHNDKSKYIVSKIRSNSPLAHHNAIETHKECYYNDDGT